MQHKVYKVLRISRLPVLLAEDKLSGLITLQQVSCWPTAWCPLMGGVLSLLQRSVSAYYLLRNNVCIIERAMSGCCPGYFSTWDCAPGPASCGGSRPSSGRCLSGMSPGIRGIFLLQIISMSFFMGGNFVDWVTYLRQSNVAHLLNSYVINNSRPIVLTKAKAALINILTY